MCGNVGCRQRGKGSVGCRDGSLSFMQLLVYGAHVPSTVTASGSLSTCSARLLTRLRSEVVLSHAGDASGLIKFQVYLITLLDFQWPVVMIYLLNQQMLNRPCHRVWGCVSVGVLKLSDIQGALLPDRLGTGTAGGRRALLLSAGQERVHSVCTVGRLPWSQQLAGCD